VIPKTDDTAQSLCRTRTQLHSAMFFFRIKQSKREGHTVRMSLFGLYYGGGGTRREGVISPDSVTMERYSSTDYTDDLTTCTCAVDVVATAASDHCANQIEPFTVNSPHDHHARAMYATRSLLYFNEKAPNRDARLYSVQLAARSEILFSLYFMFSFPLY